MGSTTIEQIHTLWQAAEALVHDCPEPCWGLAQRLSEMAEQLVQAEPELGWPADACAGCGGRGGHQVWCIHAFEQMEAERAQGKAEAADRHDQGFLDIMSGMDW